MLGSAVRQHAAQQRELDAMHHSLSEERISAYSASQNAKLMASESAEARELVAKLQAELDVERSEREASEAAAAQKAKELQDKVDELEEKERRRLELQAALDAAEPEPAMPAASIAVAQAPPPPPPSAGFDVSAGGFSL